MFERSCRELGHDVYRELLSFVARRVRCRDAAAELTQESYARVLAAEHAGTRVTDPRALLFSAARHLVIDAARHRAVERAWRDDRAGLASPFAPSAEFQVALRHAVQAVVAALEALPARRREVFLMFRVWGHTRAEIAAALGVTEAAVAKHVVRATLDCAAALAEAHAAMPTAEWLPARRPDAGLAGAPAWQA